LRRDEHNAHENVSGREMMVDGRSERRSAHGQPPGLRNEEVGAQKCDQPNDNQKNEAHWRENPPGQIFDLSHLETVKSPETEKQVPKTKRSLSQVFPCASSFFSAFAFFSGILAGGQRLLLAPSQKETFKKKHTKKKHALTNLFHLSKMRFVLGVR
jgi:hypothetical protein